VKRDMTDVTFVMALPADESFAGLACLVLNRLRRAFWADFLVAEWGDASVLHGMWPWARHVFVKADGFGMAKVLNVAWDLVETPLACRVDHDLFADADAYVAAARAVRAGLLDEAAVTNGRRVVPEAVSGLLAAVFRPSLLDGFASDGSYDCPPAVARVEALRAVREDEGVKTRVEMDESRWDHLEAAGFRVTSIGAAPGWVAEGGGA